MVYGYIRVSTERQDCENQKLGIERKAKELGLKIDMYISDRGMSGTRKPNERALGNCLKRLKRGDVIICSELSRLGRKLFMIMGILEHCINCGARIYTVKDSYELGDNIQSKIMAFAFALSAEIERNLISQRTKEALERRRVSGQKLGRPLGSRNSVKKLDGQRQRIEKLLNKGVPKSTIAKKLNVSTPTLYAYIVKDS